ncbi:MAG: aldehyde dehydrogenase family protein [Acidobacteria bacterium]|nr:aldehyde dehydrogenase family protein [Acidobacteriota bacterium]MBI3663725.1 aldehyde dehydrogenase family protein [Acidobacteriota bacterium]
MTQATGTFAPARGFLLDGRWLAEGELFDIRAPHDGSVVGTAHRATRAHLDAAIGAAAKAFDATRKMPAYERQRILQAIAAGATARREELARVLALEAGKPIRAARAEVDRAIFTFGLAAEESTRIYGEWLPLDLQAATAGRWAIVRRFPIGPIASITPFNFPVNLVAHKWGPAIAAGCSIVHKPAPQTPLCSLLLAEIVAEAGWPRGALNVLPLTNEDAGQLVSDDRLKLLSFTGSGPVGWELKRRAGKKRVALELGGIAGCIIHRDADLAYAAERCVFGGFSYAGQSCISVQRVFVERSVYEKFLGEFVPRVQKLQLGPPLDEATDVGPMISADAARRAVEWIDEAVAGGARVLCGGKRAGAMLEPTVLTGTKPSQRVNCMEMFAPALSVEPYDDFFAAMQQVNSSEYGLQAGVFTSDMSLGFAAYDTLDVGGVILNDVPTFRIDHMPYGGVKDSGAGREGIRYAIEEMTERKLLAVNLR